MIDKRYLLQHQALCRSNLKKKGYDLDCDAIQSLNDKIRHLQTTSQEIKESLNVLSKTSALLVKQGGDITELSNRSKQLSHQLSFLEADKITVQEKLDDILLNIPNFLDESVEERQLMIRQHGDPKSSDFHRSHVEALHIDLETACKVSQSRFCFLSGSLASLHRAIAQFMLDTHVYEHGYREVYVPYLANSKSLFGSGQLPKMADALYSTQDGLYLIPTSEVSLVNMVQDSIISSLPIKYVACSPCFRKEAGSYGKESRGLIRQHQFEKVELINITLPEDGEKFLESITQEAESILKKLHLPYRVVQLAADDTGFSSAKTYDLEVWCPGQKAYVEISSASWCKDFQSRRMSARFRSPTGMVFPHTLNASALAVGRTLVAVIENYQQSDGYVEVPQVLRSYMRNVDKIKIF